jgi:uncharacterized protein YggU (UPF0235/DUF167 family)
MSVKANTIKLEIVQLEDKGWDYQNIMNTLSHKYRIRKTDVEVMMLQESRRKTDSIEGWLMRKEI